MQSFDRPGGRSRNGPRGKHMMAVGIALFATLISGCGSYSPVRGLPSGNANKVERCPLGQKQTLTIAFWALF